jgi:parallel beta-helix repeat protein
MFPKDRSTIQEAIDAATSGDTILVASGTYYENLVINKPISLVGESREDTILDGSGFGDIIYVSSDGVKVSNFTIRNSGRNNPDETIGDAGVKMVRVRNCSVSNCLIVGNCFGIFMTLSNSNTLENNVCHSNDAGGILLFQSCNGNRLINNTSNSNGGFGGILLRIHCNYNTIIRNTCEWNSRWDQHGIKLLEFCDNNILEKNTSMHNGDGMFLLASSNNLLKNNVLNSDIRAGVQVYIGCYNNTLINNVCDMNEGEGISLYFSSDNNTVRNNVCSNNSNRGILLWSCNNNMVMNNTCSFNQVGLAISGSSYNKVFYNVLSKSYQGLNIGAGQVPEPSQIEHMAEFGIEPRYNSTGNWISWNNITKNDQGLVIETTENFVHWNFIEGNKNGVVVGSLLNLLNLSYNWWGSDTGPHNDNTNLDGKGDYVPDDVLISPWLKVIKEFKLNVKLPGQIFWCVLDDENMTGEMVSYVLREGLHKVQVAPLITIESKRWSFISWSDMDASNPRIIRIEGNIDLLPVYEVQYYINVTSEHGKASGSGWYTEGSSAMVSIDQTTVSAGLFTVYVFEGWMDERGGILSESSAYTFVTNRSINLNATWNLEINQMSIFVILAIIIIVVIGFAYLHLSQNSSAKDEERERRGRSVRARLLTVIRGRRSFFQP